VNNLAHRPTSKSPRVRAITDPCDRLREAIVSGEFQPNERLVEADLSVRLGVGRTAIRAALTVLDQEGLIVREPNRGARVRLISAREALEIEQVRNALERLLTRSAAGRATDTDLADLRAIVSTMAERLREFDSLGYSQLNGHLHRRIWRIADNQVAIKVLVTLKSQSIRFQYGTMFRPGRPEQSLREHEAIVAAIAAHDPDACDAAMAEHLGHVLETLQWAIEAQDSQRPWSALREPVLNARSGRAARR
jgi:DNA-binding GntR family transcriptional regulator